MKRLVCVILILLINGYIVNTYAGTRVQWEQIDEEQKQWLHKQFKKNNIWLGSISITGAHFLNTANNHLGTSDESGLLYLLACIGILQIIHGFYGSPIETNKTTGEKYIYYDSATYKKTYNKKIAGILFFTSLGTIYLFSQPPHIDYNIESDLSQSLVPFCIVNLIYWIDQIRTKDYSEEFKKYSKLNLEINKDYIGLSLSKRF